MMKIYGVTGWKNAGKTGLMERLVAEFTARGISVSTVKHAHHSFDVDHKGKDSYRHRIAGAQEVMLASTKRWALMHESRPPQDPALAELLSRLSPVDLVLVEGYKRDRHPKVEAFRAETGNPLIAPEDETIRAVASDSPLEGLDRPVFDLNNTSAIADFILKEVGWKQDRSEIRPNIVPPPLRNDCFALPAGVNWIPVDEALERLQKSIHPVTGREEIAVDLALGRILAEDAVAVRANPPGPNSAVDGYGFAHETLDGGVQVLPLVQGRSAAGAAFAGTLPAGHAVRILTGALLPDGVDTVVLQEDVTLQEGHIAFQSGVRAGANTRKAGEDVQAGEKVLAAGTKLRAPELALLSGVGLSRIMVRKRLRVGVLSSGDEIVPPGSTMDVAKTYDANRPMLLALARGWDCEAIDLGHVPDRRDLLRDAFDEASGKVDVIMTSGGASAGEEDHVSALLTQEGTMQSWRIAMKPGRPLALALWKGIPVFGLPGNPVAALVCALVFARPALLRLAGGAWAAPMGFEVPAAFAKVKKPGRREYLRARINAKGEAEVFKSEGSGRISGLSWADGLVELKDGELSIKHGDPVRFFPYASFGVC